MKLRSVAKLILFTSNKKPNEQFSTNAKLFAYHEVIKSTELFRRNYEKIKNVNHNPPFKIIAKFGIEAHRIYLM